MSLEILASARSSPYGLRVSWTDDASARYSRWRLTASWTSRATIGARMASTIATTNTIAWAAAPPSLSRSRLPAAAPEREAQEEVREEGDRAHQDADDQREPDVEVADVGQLVAR